MKTPKRMIPIGLLAVSILILSCKLGGSAAPTATPLPPTPIPGWEKFSGGGIELCMPASFEGGDLSTDLDVIVASLRALGPDYKQMADTIEQNPSTFVLLILNSNIGSGGFLTNVNVTKEQVLSSMKVDDYMDVSVGQLEQLNFTLIDRKTVQLDDYTAGRLVIQADALHAKELMYIIKNKNTMWVITYATGINEFEKNQSIFDRSANTIQIQP